MMPSRDLNLAPTTLVEMLALAILFHAIKPVYFDATPLRSQVAIGVQLERKKKGVDATLQDDAAVIGKWSDGRTKLGIEQAIWISPTLVSRRLGWLQSREGWTDAEVQSRWNVARERLNGKLTFVVRLCAFPREDVINEDSVPSRDVTDIDAANASIDMFSKDGMEYSPMAGTCIAKLVGHDREDALSMSLEGLAPFAHIFAGDLQPATLDPNLDFGLGDYHTDFWMEEVAIPADLYASKTIEVQITTARKKRVATFALVRGRPASKTHRR